MWVNMETILCWTLKGAENPDITVVHINVMAIFLKSEEDPQGNLKALHAKLQKHHENK